MSTKNRLIGVAIIAALAFTACSGSQSTLPTVTAQAVTPTSPHNAPQSCTAALRADGRIAQGCTNPGDPCQGGSLTVCGGSGFPAPPGNPGGQGGGNGPGHCPQMVGFAGNPCFPGAPGKPIAFPGHKAHFQDQCTQGTLTIGQEVPGFGDPSHLASGTWTVNVTSGASIDVLGYLYPTLGGKVYFVPLPSSINVFLFGITFNSSTPVGTTATIAQSATIANALSKYLHGAQVMNPVNCYPGGDWDGTYPS